MPASEPGRGCLLQRSSDEAIIVTQVGWKTKGVAARAAAETSPLSPLPSPSHRPGEGDPAEVMVLIGGIFSIGNDAEKHPYWHHRFNQVPLSRTVGGRWERGQG